jgi:hypothetical protein
VKAGMAFMLCLAPGVWRVFGSVPDLLAHLPRGASPRSPMDFRAAHLIFVLGGFCFAHPTDTAQVRRSARRNHRRNRSVSSTCASIIVAGVGAAMQFCGADKHSDHPYCVRHSRRAYSSLASRAAEKQRWLQRKRAA